MDQDGNLFVAGATQRPQFAPGVKAFPELDNDAGLLPVNHMKKCMPSSYAPGRESIYCTDCSTLTWWQPVEDDVEPHLLFRLGKAYDISAIRLWWRDEGLDYEANVLPGPFQFKVEGMRASDNASAGAWFTIVDKSDNAIDMLIDFMQFDVVTVNDVRLTITGWPEGITPALIDCSIFGVLHHEKSEGNES
jgi:hypothetical protein